MSNDQHRAREAAEAVLRDGQAGTAYVERVYTAIATPALSLCYVRTGTGWQARLSSGRVEWQPFMSAASERGTCGERHGAAHAAKGEAGP